jgi:dTDP-4-dehydrorhamnose reductase
MPEPAAPAARPGRSLKVVLIGAGGQLGSDLLRLNPGHDLVPISHADLDVADAAAVERAVRAHAPRWVINTAAYHRTDECEDFPEKAFQVNAFGARNLGRACAAAGARLVHFSTDYVFDGSKRTPYREGDEPRPLSVYGASKLAGEHLARAASDGHIVVRSAGLFGAAGSSGKGGNFVEMVLRRAKAGETLEVVDDIVMSPTYTFDLAATVWELLAADPPGGLYHIANGGTTSWYEFARKVLALAGVTATLKPARSADRPTKARRPAYSALGSERLQELKVPTPRVWQEAVKAYLQEKGHLPASGEARPSD